MLDARRRACLTAMGVELWRARDRQVESPAERPVTGAGGHASLPDSVMPAESPEPGRLEADRKDGSSPVLDPGASTLSWGELARAVESCVACDLHPTRTRTVFGVGDRNASLMVIGEAPGADEDRQGEPFVGRAGQLLNAMLEAIGFTRDQVYIANIIKCRPPGNRDPHIEETAACQPFLHRQIELLQPRLILSVGRISAHNLLGTEESVGRLRGRVHRFDPGDIPLIVTYHPAYLLRRPEEKSKAWQDLQAAYRQLNQG